MSEVTARSAPVRPSVRVQLPSRGIPYDGKLPDGWVDLSPMTTQEEKMLLSPKQDRLTALFRVVERCLQSKEVPLRDMLVSDRMYLLLELRNITYGTEYTMHLQCRGCGREFTVQVNLPEGLETRVLTPDDTEPFEVTLPVSKTVLGLRLLRVRDEDEVQRYVARTSSQLKVDAGDLSYTYRLARHIVTIDGEEVDTTRALSFCEAMVGGDSLVMRTAIEEHDCGVELILDLACAHCGRRYEEILPFTTDFFRPGAGARRRRREYTKKTEGASSGAVDTSPE